MEQVLYFIAILPDKKLSDDIRLLKENVSREYLTRHALKSPAHITLQRPFRRNTAFEEKLISALEEFVKMETAFPVQLNGFGAFSPRVLYLKVVDHQPFIGLHARLSKVLVHKLGFTERELSASIHPHVTLAHRDLKVDEFKRAWSKYENSGFEAEFHATYLALLKHNGKYWEVLDEFQFIS